MITIQEISKRLANDSQSVCALLLPSGKVKGAEWVCGDVCGASGDSLAVTLTGEHAGQWRDWANQEHHGDLLDLWRISRGITAQEAIRQAKEFLHIHEPQPYRERVYGTPTSKTAKPVADEGRVMKWLIGERLLEPTIVRRFKIEGDKTANAIVFPSYSPDGQLVNRSFRALDKDENGKKKVWQETGCAPSLFGWQAIKPDCRTVLLCEGQIDCMTWTQWGINSLSIPNGSGLTWIEYEWANLEAFETIYVAFDMDGAGRENAQKAIERLGKHRVMLVTIPEKDANDALKAGYTASDAAGWIAEAQAPAVKNLVTGAELKKRVIGLLDKPKSEFTLSFFRTGDPSEGLYFRDGEVTVWTGITSQGKSTFLRYFMLQAVASDKRIFSANMEEDAAKCMMKIVQATCMTPHVTKEMIEPLLESIGPMFIYADALGYIERQALFEMMLFSFQRYGASHFFIDSMMRVKGLEEDYVAQGDFLNELQSFAKKTGAHVHLVAHPRKPGKDDRLGKMDVKGSSLIPNNADNIVCVSRNKEKSEYIKTTQPKTEQERAEFVRALDAMHDTEISVLKQRETGWEGNYLLKFNPRYFAFSAM